MAMESVLSEEEVGRVHGSESTVNFGRVEFLEIVHIERPSIIYRSRDTHFFFLAGLAVRTDACDDSDFSGSHVILPWISSKNS
jgi:hypothetical protein